MKKLLIPVVFFITFNLAGQNKNPMNLNKSTQYATFGGGCFWCTEAVFEELEGVKNVVSGYSGGDVINPSYRDVTTGRTGHAEVVQIEYDPNIISFRELLEVFFKTHDPTTLNRQGADIGTQYRSVIFYHNQNQEEVAREVIRNLNNSDTFNDPIVTKVDKLENFYLAEDYHQNYFKNNPGQGYCVYVIKPKMQKLKKNFSDKLKID